MILLKMVGAGFSLRKNYVMVVADFSLRLDAN